MRERPASGFAGALLIAALVQAGGCASYPPTEPLQRYDPDQGYRYPLLDNDRNGDDLFVILTFSGGGTRAAALSYGVLEQLAKESVTVGGESRNLLKEVDVISSVSGGSFTAAYYALHGGDMLKEDSPFRGNFLYRDVEGDLERTLINPYNWVRLASPTFGRIELAEEVYARLLFGDASYRELARRRQKPFLMVNATDMVKGAQFTFVQSDFDPLCADLGSVSIARAVAASSNFPVAFTPLTIDSFPRTCRFEEPDWVAQALMDLQSNPRRYYRARMLRTYREADRRHVHLLDGGVADNIGLRGPLTSIVSMDPELSVLRMIELEEISKLVVIVVDARNDTPSRADGSASPPGTFSVINAIATVPLTNYSFDTLELVHQNFRRRSDDQRLQPDLHQLELYRIYVGFDQIADDARRREFFSMETSFHLPREQVDALRRVGGEILLSSPCFRELVGKAAPRPGAPKGCP